MNIHNIDSQFLLSMSFRRWLIAPSYCNNRRKTKHKRYTKRHTKHEEIWKNGEKKVSMERIEIFKGFSLTVLHTHRMSRHESKISGNFNILRSISIFATNKFNLKITESDLFRCAFWMDLSVSVRVLRCSVWSLIFSNHRAWLISSIMLESWISK